MQSWPKPRKPRLRKRLPLLRPQQLVLLTPEQHHRLLADRDLLAGLKRQRRTAAFSVTFGQAAECNMLAACAPQSLQSQIANLESRINDARVAELADAPDLGSGAERRAGSSPVPGNYFLLKEPLPSSRYSAVE